jgi:hypothetical protein
VNKFLAVVLNSLIFAALLISNTSIADEQISATHQWLATTEQGDGTHSVTWEVMLFNQGTENLTDIELNALPRDSELLPESPALRVDSLLVGDSISLTWTTQMISPVSDELPVSFFLFQGEATDSLGNSQYLITMSSNKTGY